MAQYKLIIFDFDGTLADSFSVFVDTVNRAAKKYNFRSIEGKDIDTLRHNSAREMIKHLKVSTWKMPFVAGYMRSRMTEKQKDIKLFDRIEWLLTEIKKTDTKIAIVSSSSKESITEILGEKNAALVDYFECSSSLFGKAKKLEKIMGRSGISANQCIAIGDEIRDIEAAKKASVTVGVVSWGYTHLEALKKYQPDKCFTEVDEIMALTE